VVDAGQLSFFLYSAVSSCLMVWSLVAMSVFKNESVLFSWWFQLMV